MKELEGARIVVTRPAAPDDGLAERLTTAGAEVLRFPTFTIEPLTDRMPSGDFDWAIFTSPAAVTHGFGRLAGHLPSRLAAAGRGTARRLTAAGATHVLAPRVGAGMQALLDEIGSQKLAKQRVLLVGGEPINSRSVAALTTTGAQVTTFPVYVRRPVTKARPLTDWIRGREADAIMISSTVAVAALMALTEVNPAAAGWICSSPPVAAAVERGGGRVVAIAASADDEDMMAATIHWWQAQGNR